nr:MAG TPA: hypothetical protein [Caudoviricetes sp.]
MRSKVGNEGREMVAETVARCTPRRSAKSCCVMPFKANISFMYDFICFIFDCKGNIYIRC